ncbi:MAG: exonuclease SbcCD subunit D [Trueperaceae bacterium]|nr:exonuclease SbcCD subunit D [Trueperaceae bacterium]
MKILHTADWHAGRQLHGVDRTAEIREVLEEIAELAQQQAVDLILVAGDIYDTKNPSADAEAAVYDFFRTVGSNGIPSVVIAGNHDSPSRLDAVSHLLKLANVHVVGHPKVSSQGGVFDLPIGSETARVAALPFVSERRIVKVAELLDTDPGQWLEKYQQGMRKLIQNLTVSFSSEFVNLMLLHTTMDGATLSQSEYVFHCTETYALDADILPDKLNYAAFGHIHKSQAIKGFAENAGRYSGSILQLDFGEQGDDKFVYLVDAQPGKPTELIEAVKLQGGKKLKRLSLELDAMDRKLEDIRSYEGWLKLKLKLDQPRPGLKDRIKAEFPQVLSVEIELPEQEVIEEVGVDLQKMSLLDAYAQYYLEQRGKDLPSDLKEAFNQLYAVQDEPETEVAA